MIQLDKACLHTVFPVKPIGLDSSQMYRFGVQVIHEDLSREIETKNSLHCLREAIRKIVAKR
jgi:hypothetical protein